MPSHPDRVRQHYGPPRPAAAEVYRPEHCTACARYHLPPVGPECPYRARPSTDDPLEPDNDHLWGV